MKQEVITMVCQALAGSTPCLVLRGGDADARAGGDIDILVPSWRSLLACKLIADASNKAGWYLCGFRDIGYVASLTLVRPNDFGSDEAIKLDLISGLEWYGKGTGKVTRKFFDLLDHASDEQQDINRLIAFATFYQKIIAVGSLNEREWRRVCKDAGCIESLIDTAQAVGVPLVFDDVKEKGIGIFRKWRLRAASASLSGPLGFVLWFSQVALAHLWFRLGVGTHCGHSIGLSGLDGSGKSTQMERLFAVYRSAGSVQPKLVHLLPAWIPMPHKLLRRKKTEQNYMRPYAEAPVQSKCSGILRLSYYLIAFIVAKWWMRSITTRGQMIILDRSFLDFAADLTRSRIPDFQLPRWLIRLCAPSATLLFLDALPETVVHRKGELQFDKATNLRQRYLRMFDRVDGAVIDAEGTQDIVFTHLLGHIDAVYRARIVTATAEGTS